MKLLRRCIPLILCVGLMFSATSCLVFVKKDHGQHKGWFKPKKPHHPHSAKHPGNSKGHDKK